MIEFLTKFLQKFILNQEVIMQGLDDLKKSVASLETSVPAAVALITSLQKQNTDQAAEISTLTSELTAANAHITDLQAQVAAGGDSDAEVEDQSKIVQAQSDALSAAVPPQVS